MYPRDWTAENERSFTGFVPRSFYRSDWSELAAGWSPFVRCQLACRHGTPDVNTRRKLIKRLSGLGVKLGRAPTIRHPANLSVTSHAPAATVRLAVNSCQYKSNE